MFVIGSILPLSALASPPPGNLGQLQQLNRASEVALRHMQHPSGPPPIVKNQAVRQKFLDRWQRAEQQRLQERQRRELLLLNHRARTRPPPSLPYSLQGMQGRFQREQQNQLNRFQLQR